MKLIDALSLRLLKKAPPEMAANRKKQANKITLHKKNATIEANTILKN